MVTNHITNFVQNFPFFTIILSMFTGILCAAAKPKLAKFLCIGNLIVCGVLSFLTLSFCMTTKASYVYMMGHFPAPFGNEIRFGALETLMATAFSIVMLFSLEGGMKHIFHDVKEEKQNFYFLMMNLLYASLLALIYTNDLFTAYVFVEINTLTSCSIVMLKHSKETLVATTRSLTMILFRPGSFMIGIIRRYDITGHLLMSNIKESVNILVSTGKYQFPLEMIICLFAIGLGIKAALYPFHSWLPDAHGQSTSASSAVLSGLVLKGYIILFIKLVYRVFGLSVINNSRVLNILFIFGILAMTIGSIKAVNERDLKRMIAYSSVAQVGYIFMGIGLGTEFGMAAACFQILVHAFTKPMLFNTAGAFMDEANGSRKFKDLKGAARKNMYAGIAFAVGAFSMIGIPLFGGFAVKYNLAVAALSVDYKNILALIALVISTVLNAIYYVPAMMVLFKKDKNTEKVVFIPDKKDFGFIISNTVFIVCNFILGIFSYKFIEIILEGLRLFQ